MLRVLFQIGDARYALDSHDIHEIVPMVNFRALPGAPDFVRGVFLYRGCVTPVIDLSVLAGLRPARALMSTRVILVRTPDRRGEKRLLGLLAERVTDTMRMDTLQKQPAGVATPLTPWLGDMITEEERLVQEVDVDRLLPESVRDQLFRKAEEPET